MELLPEIARRRSVRSFTGDVVDRASLYRVLDAGRRAPSAKNRQAWRFICLTDDESRAKLQDAAFGQEWIGQAGAIIALCTTNVDYTMPNGQPSYPVDLSIAGAFMMLQAEHEGLGSCAITTFDEREAKAAINVPHRMRIVMLLAVGHIADEAEPTVRLPFDRVASFDHW